MGIVANYIEKLSDEQRDNIIEAEAFSNGQYFDYEGVGCLVGVAEREWFDERGTDTGKAPIGGYSTGARFDRLCRRFGMFRVIAACKKRAARGNAPTVTEIRKTVYRELVPAGGMSGWVQ